MMKTDSKSIFITGIDTDAGKSYATAWLALRLKEAGRNVITQKFIQTGNDGFSEDIQLHRRLTGQVPLPEDAAHLTAPVIFTYPASAQLAAQIDGREIDLTVIDHAREELEQRYDTVLVEGAGGLMVPITDTEFTIDYVCSRHLPVVLVTNSRLGSINHTVLSLEALKRRNIDVIGVIYNHYFDTAPEIAADSRRFVGQYVAREFPEAEVMDMPAMVMPAQPQITVDKTRMAAMPPVQFEKPIVVVDTPDKVDGVVKMLQQHRAIGFDTETKPSFKKGELHNVALLQLSTEDAAYLFRLNRIGMPESLKALLEDRSVTKVGLSTKDDFNVLRRLSESLSPEGFVELQSYVKPYGINEGSLQKIYAIMFGERISKGQRLTNWEAEQLTAAQCRYAAIDAWACLRIYNTLREGWQPPRM